MKDSANNYTFDAFEPPRRGRPRKESSKSGAQRQKEYRERQKALGIPSMAQALAGFHVWHLPKGCRKWRQMTDYPLSWDSAHHFVRCFVLAHGLVDSDLPELASKYEIRPAEIPPGCSSDDDKRARRPISFDDLLD